MRMAPIAAAILLAVSAAAFAADAAKEIAVAAQHAAFAAKSETLVGAHAHLHHAVNCLVGPGGEGFDPKELNPCRSMGSGAIPDTLDAGKKKLLKEALAHAKEGLAATDLYSAVKAATRTESALKQAM